MIYQFKVNLKGMKPPVWRRLQLDGRTTFAQLHEVLQIVFDWEDEHLHSTTMLRRGGEKIHSEIGIQEEDPSLFYFMEEFDEEVETLSRWFLEEKDRALYTYDFGDDWEHEIVLEKILPPIENVHYPKCVKAIRTTPPENSRGSNMELPEVDWRELTAELDEQLAELELAYPVLEEDHPFDWTQLITAANALNDSAPWKELHDDQVFAVFDSESDQFVYCCVLGAAGQEYGLAVYIGDEGLSILKDTVNGNIEEDILMKQRSLLLAFSDRDELDDEDLAFLNQYGAFRKGTKQYVQLRSFVPGFVPWSLDHEEGRMLLLAIQQTQVMLALVKKGVWIPKYSGGDEMIARLPMQQGPHVEWETAIVQFKNKTPDPAESYLSEIDIKRIQKLKPTSQNIQFGLFMIPTPVHEEINERPFFPLMAIAIDSDNNSAIYQELTRADEQEIAVQFIFMETLNQLQAIPQTLQITEHMAKLLAPITNKLPIQVQILSKLTGVENFREFIKQMEFE